MAVAKANNLDIETVNVDLEAAGEEYKKVNPLSKVPTFVGADGYTLYECIAIAIYGTFIDNMCWASSKRLPCLAPHFEARTHTSCQI